MPRPKDPYAEELPSPKPNSTLPNELVYNILVFLDASPLSLFIGAPHGGPEWQTFFDDIFVPTMRHLVSEDERVRTLTNAVARRVLNDGSLSFWSRSQSRGEAHMFTNNFWRST